MGGLLHRNWPIYRNAQKYQKYSFSNGRFGPKRKAAAGCLNREHAALNIWRESATSNFKKQPKTAVSPFRRRRAPARKFVTFFYWLTINFSFWVQLPYPRKAGRFKPFIAPTYANRLCQTLGSREKIRFKVGALRYWQRRQCAADEVSRQKNTIRGSCSVRSAQLTRCQSGTPSVA